MPDHAAQRCIQDKGLNLVNGSNNNASQSLCMNQWIARWTRTCKSSSSNDCCLPNTALSDSLVLKSKVNEYLALDEAKSEELKLLRVNMNQRYTLGYKGKSSSADVDVDPMLYALQSSETHKVGSGKFEMGESSTMRRNMELFNDEAAFLGKISTQQLTQSSIKWENSRSYNCRSLGISQSEFEHFPDRKIEAMMNSSKHALFIKMNKESSSLNEKVMIPCEGLLLDNTDVIGLASSRIFQINDKLLKAVGRSDTDSNSRSFGSSWTSLKDGSIHVLRESSPSFSSYPFSSDRHGTEEKDDSSDRLFLDKKRLKKSDGSYENHCHCKNPTCSLHDANLHDCCQNFKAVESGEGFLKLSSMIKHLLAADNVCLDQCLSEPNTGDSAFAQVKKIAYLEKSFIQIGRNYGMKELSTVPFRTFTSDKDKNDRVGSGTYLMRASNVSSTTTNTIYNQLLYKSISLPGETLSTAQKGVVSSNLRTDSAYSFPIKQGVIFEKRVDHPASSNRLTYASHNEASTSLTDSMALDQNILLTMIAGNTLSSNTCCKKVKCLRDSQPENLSLCTQKLKDRYASSGEYNNPNTISSSKNIMPCSDDFEKYVQLWIKRWSHNCHEISLMASRSGVPPAFQPKSSEAMPENFEGKLLGSIRAMSLMSKALNNYRPYKLRRKKASLVWNN